MKFRSLKKKLSTSVLIIAIILASMASIVAFITELERASIQTDVMLNQLLDTVEGTAAIAAYSRNQQIAEDVLKGLLKNDIVYEAQIKSEQAFNLKLSKNSLISHEKIIKRALVSPFGDGEVIGYLLVQPTARFKLIEAEHGAMINALTSIIIIAITSIAIFLIIQSNISKPLAHVSDTLHAIRLGHKQRIPEIKKNKNDELGRLVFDINHLLEVLEDKYNNEITLRKKVESIEKQLRHMINSKSAGLFLLDEQGQIIDFNETLEKIFKKIVSDTAIENNTISSYFQEQDDFKSLIIDVLETSQLEAQDFSLRVEKNTPPIWVHCLLSKIIDESGQVFIEGVIFDVTKRVEIEKAIAYEANHDMLTGLLRRQATELMYQAYIKTSNSIKASFLFLDLDGFKQANDTYGHLAGDEVLIITSKRLINCVRDEDIVCRLGGDEFLIILIDCSEAHVHRIAKDIIASVQENIFIDDDINIKIGVSMGIAHANSKLREFDALSQAADEAMYIVKKQGKNGYCESNEEKKFKVIRELTPA